MCLCVCVCVCVSERERQTRWEQEIGGGEEGRRWIFSGILLRPQ